MRILVANKFWYRRGGLERVMFDEIEWLEEAGHEVAHFASAHPKNEPSAWADYFSPYLELGGAGLGAADKVRAASRMFSNGPARRSFNRLLSAFRPDVVHVHGIHRQLSPSILTAAARHGVPVVQTLHDYHHICPADVLLFAGTEACEPRRCGNLWYGAAVAGKCVRGSLAASALSAAETSWQRASRAYDRGVARFISPSQFLADRMKEAGWTAPCDVVRNGVPRGERALPGEGFVVIGRLSHEKGIAVALAAARLAGVQVTVAGEGPRGQALVDAFPEAAFPGHLSARGVAALVRGSRAVVVPSLCLENAPMAVLESMAVGVAVIASDIGGIPEQITDGVDGILVRPGDVEALAQTMRHLEADSALASRLGAAAVETVSSRFSPEVHTEGVLAAYRAAGAVSV